MKTHITFAHRAAKAKCSICNQLVSNDDLIIAVEVYVGLKKLQCDAIVLKPDGSISAKQDEQRVVVGRDDDGLASPSKRRVFEVLDIENDDNQTQTGAKKRKRDASPDDAPSRPPTGQSAQEAICLD